MKDVVYVQHIASPYPSGLPKHVDEVMRPACEGTLRVLRHAHDAGSVIRVVLTSSAAANGAGLPHSTTKLQSFDEEDWGNPDSSNISAYPKSKILAERAAWEYIESGANLELTTINPALILGPILDAHTSTSLRTVVELLEGNISGLPRLSFSVVDVRDCANMHVMAMTHPKADKERFLCVSDNGVSMLDLAKILKKNLGSKANKVPTLVLPNFLIHIVAIFLPIARLVVPDLGILTSFSNAKAKQVLGWASQYTTEQMIVASAESLFDYKAVKV